MGRFTELAEQWQQQHMAHDDIRQDTLTAVRDLRAMWANACLSLAESLDWESVEYKQAHGIVAGQYGWRLFCSMANLTMLRDQVFPVLLTKLTLDRPPDDNVVGLRDDD